MKATTIRIDKSTHHLLKSIVLESNQSMNELINEMSIEFQKRYFWSKVNSVFLALKSNKEEWNEELNERGIWDITLGDSSEE